MFQASTKKLLLVLIFSISSMLVAEDYQPGKHYQVLSEPIATRDSKKIEVIEFFWFGCGHCYSLENRLNSWEKKLPADIDFWRSPITWNEMAKTHAKLFYAAEFFKKPEIISNTFVSIHANQRMMTSDRELQPFFASFGIAEISTNLCSILLQCRTKSAELIPSDSSMKSEEYLLLLSMENTKYQPQDKLGLQNFWTWLITLLI